MSGEVGHRGLGRFQGSEQSPTGWMRFDRDQCGKTALGGAKEKGMGRKVSLNECAWPV